MDRISENKLRGALINEKRKNKTLKRDNQRLKKALAFIAQKLDYYDEESFEVNHDRLLDKMEESTFPIGFVTVSEMKEQLAKIEKRGLGDKPIISVDEKSVITVINSKKDKVWFYALELEDEGGKQ